MIKDALQRLGVLRSLLVALTFLVIAAMPFADVTASPAGWGIIKSAVLPAAGPIVFMVLMLDVMMSQIFKADATEQQRKDLNFAIKVYGLVTAMLIVSWLPVFLKATYF